MFLNRALIPHLNLIWALIPQEFLAIDETCTLSFLFNFDITERGPWKRVTFSHCPPSCVPSGLARFGVVWRVEHKRSWPLQASIRDKTLKLTVAQLKQIFAVLEIPLPQKLGSGKKGGIIKIDWCKHLVDHLFLGVIVALPGGDEASRKEMTEALTGCRQKTVDVDILSAVAHLDTENLQAFKHLQKAAVETMELGVYGSAEAAEKKLKGFDLEKAIKQTAPKVEEAKKKHEEKVNAKSIRNWGQTPEDLKTLLPGSGEVKGVFWAALNKLKKFFRIDYPISALAEPEYKLISYSQIS